MLTERAPQGFWKKHWGRVLDNKDGYDVIDCRVCKFKHVIPLPGKDEVNNYYRNKFYIAEKAGYFKLHQKDSAWWNMAYARRYRRFEKLLAPRRRRILDIGCGPGFFLKLGRERGWQTLGIEPSARAAAYAKKFGLKIINGFLDKEKTKRLGKFDAIHMSSVMEHLSNPQEALRRCFCLLKPAGIFCAVVANDYNPLQKILREEFGFRPWWVVPPEHINYFSINSLKQKVTECGFEIVHTTVTFPMEIFLLWGENYIENKQIGRACHNRRKDFEFALAKNGREEFLSKLYQGFAKLNIGRDIILTARKPLKKTIQMNPALPKRAGV